MSGRIESYFSAKRRLAHDESGSPVCKVRNTEKENLDARGPAPNQTSGSDGSKGSKELALERLKMRIPGAEGMGISWKKALAGEFSKDYFKKVTEFVEEERRHKVVYPSKELVYKWSMYCDVEAVRVVILGQDPYHGAGQAHGLCFSVPVGVPIPPSLENIYKELVQNEVDFRHPGHGHLVGWARQGVLLLNACLTVEASRANSHQGRGWEHLTDAVIAWINGNLNNVVFMLWGAFAQNKCKGIDKDRHLLLACAHPSPLSAHKGFFGCRHFSRANKYLVSRGLDPIDWSDLPTK